MTFQPKSTTFHAKTLDVKINTFFSKFTEVNTKIPPFYYENVNPGFPKKIPLYSRILELGCVWSSSMSEGSGEILCYQDPGQKLTKVAN